MSELAGVKSAIASSNFDNFPVSDDWTIHNIDCSPVDLRYTWGGIIASQAPDAQAQIVANGTNGGWYVWRQDDNSIKSALVIMIVKAESAPSNYTIANHLGGSGWLANSGNQWLYTTTEGTRPDNTYELRIVLDSSCEPYVENYSPAGGIGYSEKSYFQTPEYIGMPDLTGRPFSIKNSILLAVGDFIAPAGYEGPMIPDTVPEPTYLYVAMGDSFSSGEGIPPFENGTDIDDVNECHRSSLAYPRLLQSELNLDTMAFVACSGATTSSIINGQWKEPSQLAALSSETEVVTLTIGGNDVGFSEFAKKCLSPLNWPGEEVCDEFTDAYDDITEAILNNLPSSLENVYGLILEAAPNAEIYVGGYPIVAPWMAANEPFDQDCGGLYDEAPTNTWGDARAAYDVVTSLNAAIETAVLDVMVAKSTTRLHYVDVENGAFSGHDICESDSYFNGNDFFNPEYSVHPNIDGQAAYAADFEIEMD